MGHVRLLQGGFFACQVFAGKIPGVSIVMVQVICMLGLGLGMGLVDGSCPAMLAERKLYAVAHPTKTNGLDKDSEHDSPERSHSQQPNRLIP